LLLAGDLTTHGEPQQAEVLVEACAALEIPVVAVLGNHDWHANRRDELVSVLEAGGITVLDGSTTTCRVGGTEVGIVGVKGFVGGFPGSHLPDFGEPLLRRVYADTTHEVEALETIVGEPAGIWAFLGSDRLAAPIAEHEPDLVLHGHAHAGTFQGSIGDVPVYNVSVPVMGRDFWLFELDVTAPARTPIH
jgi:Icc-related predicted phosphoesterase